MTYNCIATERELLPVVVALSMYGEVTVDRLILRDDGCTYRVRAANLRADLQRVYSAVVDAIAAYRFKPVQMRGLDY